MADPSSPYPAKEIFCTEEDVFKLLICVDCFGYQQSLRIKWDIWKGTQRYFTLHCTLSNLSIKTGKIPQKWKVPPLSLIPKSQTIAGNFRWVQIFAIFAERPASAKIKTAKKCTKMEVDDVITCVRRYKLVPVWMRWRSTVCLTSKWLL